MVGRQVAYKRLDLAVDAFNALGLKLKVVGEGEEISRQQPRAKSNIEFTGWLSDRERNKLFAGARAFIWPQEEDFGITAVEAMAAGCPVIAFNKGGAREYVTEGVTGALFDQQTPAALVEAIRRFEVMSLDESAIRNRALEFDSRVFRSKLADFVNREWKKFEHKKSPER